MKENNVVQGILIFLIFVCITRFGIGYIRHKLSPTPVNPNNNSNNTNDVIEFAEPPEITIEEVRTINIHFYLLAIIMKFIRIIIETSITH